MDEVKKELFDDMIIVIQKYDKEAAFTLKDSDNLFISDKDARDWNFKKGWDHREDLIDDLSKLFQVDENAETLEDKLRMEHRPIPEEREDASLFETMAEKFRPKA